VDEISLRFQIRASVVNERNPRLYSSVRDAPNRVSVEEDDVAVPAPRLDTLREIVGASVTEDSKVFDLILYLPDGSPAAGVHA
jgi:hypothetical protein